MVFVVFSLARGKYFGLIPAVVVGVGLYIIEKRITHGQKDKLSNYLKVDSFSIFIRTVNAVFSLICFIIIFETHTGIYAGIDSFLFTRTFYFASCDPLPPAKSKVRKALEKLRELFSPTPEPIPQES